ncbi:flagellin [Rubripirellula amarantea]|uniref:Flagellin n=1 Tax=Rubripirellula amarantea TaxID=2527999 RepID=A0A5C5WEY5_9BACT|nr:flagellin [Rubripirellula amarantea]MDA8745375.1 flagellin [Rubripirellula amarantea]TWT49200.1 B-type flagellin [Rubripirellula amarantea]
MTRINTNVSSLVAQNRLQASNKDLNSALTRLSTGLRINSGSDDPAGLIASEALRSEITGLGKAISNTQRASQIISTADSALGQVGTLLTDIRGLVAEAANSGALSDEEIAANQLQIDSSLEAIDRIAQTTTFQGRKLLDGSLDYKSTAGSVSSVQDINISKAKLGSTGKIDVEVVVSAAATQGEVSVSDSGFTAAANATASTDKLAVVTQAIGGEDIDITGVEGFTDIVINDVTDASSTGSASYNADTGTLTITGNFTGDSANPGEIDADVDADIVQAAINNLEGFTATGSTGSGTPAAASAATVAAAADGLTVSALNAGSDYNNVTIEFVSGASTEASFDAEQKKLTVSVDSSGLETAENIAAAIEAVQVNGEAVFEATGLADANYDISEGIASITTGNTGGEVLNDKLVFQLSGADGAETFNFGAGTSKDQIAAALNLVSDSTGVSASVVDGSLTFNTNDYGSAASVSVDVISEGSNGTFESSLSATSGAGTDISATVNGVAASGKGNSLSINTSSLSLEMNVDNSGSNFSFSINGGGATFQLGPQVNSTQQASLGIGSVSTGQLGGASGRLYELGTGQSKSLSNDVSGAAKVIEEVISKVTALRGRLGAFQSTTLDSNLVSLSESRTSLQEAESSIRDADFAQESANLTRAQILVQSGTNVLSLANQNPQSALQLLG